MRRKELSWSERGKERGMEGEYDQNNVCACMKMSQ